MTLKKLAEICNYSVATVSRALNNSFDVSEETRQEILKTARDYGYFKEKKRVKIENRKTNLFNFAIICPEIISPYYSNIVSLLMDEFRINNGNCTIYSSGFDKNTIADLVEKASNDPTVDGIICLSKINGLKPGGIPVGDFSEGGMTHSHVICDMQAGIDSIVEYLISKNIRSAAFAGEWNTYSKSECFSRAAKKFGLENAGDYSDEARFDAAGAKTACELLKRDALPGAVVCAYDEIAYGLLEVLAAQGIRAPEDIIVVGIGNSPASRYCFGGITTLDFSFRETCSKLASDFVNARKSGVFVPRNYIVTSRLVAGTKILDCSSPHPTVY